ncbi:myelin-associated glycoprotein-like [Strongylocentrotus purpuratus]|uniref:Ig-like domain-containing protein n=1 Tax=Strongylocentrotus purpuratus TaxID=7668 RepID=A0A7M7NCL5_STRPU|nr:myelin-associated glycoprotein-like [Strongylocentrotus purpuratus]
MTAGEPRDITCTVRGARPPALIEWRTDAEHIHVMDQGNVVKGQSYISHRGATITPSKDYHNRIIRCLASHRELQNVLQATILLNVQELQLSASSNISNLLDTPTLVVFQNVPAFITCKCLGSRPVAILFWELGDTVVTEGVTSSVTPNSMDKSLFDAENTPQMSGTGDLQDGMSASVTCIVNNGYPAPIFQWNLGTADLTNKSATENELNEYNRMYTRSVLTFTPKKSDHGQYLACEVFQPEAQPTWFRSVRKTIEISYPPVIVDLSARRSSDGEGRMYALLTCQVDARPPACIFEWFFNGSKLENNTKIAVHQWDFQETEMVTSTLMIGNPKVINEGNYKCLTRTSMGNDSAAIYFTFPSE